jgi:AcrR family transcriptional regulator
MGRRSEHTPEALKALIIEASERIISTEGLSGLSAREIARSVGYSAGTIYNVFHNLDDLILQIEARLLDALDERLSHLPAQSCADQHLKTLAREYLAFTTERPRLWNVLFEHHMPPTMLVPEWYQVKLDRVLQHVERAFHQINPDADKATAIRSARVLWASVHGITSLATTDKLSNVTVESAQALIDDLVTNYTAGFQHRRIMQAA